MKIKLAEFSHAEVSVKSVEFCCIAMMRQFCTVKTPFRLTGAKSRKAMRASHYEGPTLAFHWAAEDRAAQGSARISFCPFCGVPIECEKPVLSPAARPSVDFDRFDSV